VTTSKRQVEDHHGTTYSKHGNREIHSRNGKAQSTSNQATEKKNAGNCKGTKPIKEEAQTIREAFICRKRGGDKKLGNFANKLRGGARSDKKESQPEIALRMGTAGNHQKFPGEG